MTSRTTFQKNVEINLAFGNPKGNPDAPNWPAIKRQYDITLSEFNELDKAVKGNNWVQVMDGQGDVTTTNDGIAHIAGFDEDREYSRLSDSDKLSLNQFGDFKGNKFDPNWSILRDHLEFSRPILESIQSLIETTDYVGIQNTVPYVDELNRIFARLAGIDSDLVLDAVYVSNLTKLIKDEDELQATIAKYAEQGVTVAVFGEFPTKYVKSDREQPFKGEIIPAGKFLKGINFKEPDFSKVMA